MPCRIRIVDAHHHLWDPFKNPYPWLAPGAELPPKLVPLRRRYLPDDYRADMSAVDLIASVHVEAAWESTSQLRESVWLQQIASNHRLPTIFVAGAQLESPIVSLLLGKQAAIPQVRGIRQMLNLEPQRRLLTSGAWLAGYSLLARYGLSFDLQVSPEQMRDAAAAIATAPDVAVVINHAGLLPRNNDPRLHAEWKQGVARLAQFEWVGVKFSGLIWPSGHAAPADLEYLYELFGPKRAMFASNMPVDGLFGSLADQLAVLDPLVCQLDEADSELFFQGNATTFYRIDATRSGGSETLNV